METKNVDHIQTGGQRSLGAGTGRGRVENGQSNADGGRSGSNGQQYSGTTIVYRVLTHLKITKRSLKVPTT